MKETLQPFGAKTIYRTARPTVTYCKRSGHISLHFLISSSKLIFSIRWEFCPLFSYICTLVHPYSLHRNPLLFTDPSSFVRITDNGGWRNDHAGTGTDDCLLSIFVKTFEICVGWFLRFVAFGGFGYFVRSVNLLWVRWIIWAGSALFDLNIFAL